MKKLLINLMALSACIPALTAQTHTRIGVDDETDVKIYCVGALDGNKGVYQLSGQGAYSATKISTGYIDWYFGKSGGTFTDKETVYGTYDASYNKYAVKAAAGADNAWTKVFMNYRDSSYKNYDATIICTDMVYDATSQKIYGWFHADTYDLNWWLASYDGDNVTVTPIGSRNTLKINAMAASPDGILYGINGDAGRLYTIDKTTGATTQVATLSCGGGITGDNQSAAWDPVSGKIFWAGYANAMSGSLYSIDPTDGTTTKIYDFPMGSRFNSFYIAPAATSKKAPAAVADLSAVFTGSGTNVKVTFTAPSLTIGGSNLTGDLTAEIKVDGVTNEEVTLTPGASFEKVYELSEGDHLVSVTCTNNSGSSPQANANVYVGFGEPLAVQNLVAEELSSSVHLSWDAAQAEAGKILDASAITYTVTQYPGADVLAQAITTTNFDAPLPTGPMRDYYWTVTVCNNGTPGPVSKSNSLSIGLPESIPYNEDFEGGTSFEDFGFVAIDGTQYSYHERYNWGLAGDDANHYAKFAAAMYFYQDDYLMTPMISFEGGKEYKLTFKLSSSLSTRDTDLKIYLTSERAEAAAPVQIITEKLTYCPPSGQENVFSEQTLSFTPETSGIYSVAFYLGSSEYNRSQEVRIDDISILLPYIPVAPAAVNDFKAEQTVTGGNEIKLTATLPTLDKDGQELASLDKVIIKRGETVVHEVTEGLVKGAEYSYIDTNVPTGEHIYTMTVFQQEHESQVATAIAESGYRYDLTILSVEYPKEKVAAGEGAVVKATVKNLGFRDAEGASIILSEDVDQIKNIDTMAPNAEQTVEFALTPNLSDEEVTRAFTLQLSWENEENKANDNTTEFSVTFEAAPYTPAAPAAPDDFEAMATEDGGHHIAMMFTLPTLDVNGKNLAELSKVEIRRGYDLVHEATEDLKPGTMYCYTDLNVPSGEHTYSLTVHQLGHISTPVQATAESGYGYDLAIIEVDYPTQAVAAGDEAKVTVTVENKGFRQSSDAVLTLDCNGNKTENTVGALDADAVQAVEFALDPNDSEQSVTRNYSVSLEYADDANPSNNEPVNFAVTFDGVSGMNGIAVNDAIEIYPGMILVNANGHAVTVADVQGRVMYTHHNASESARVMVTPGVYVVNVDGRSVKINIK